MNRLSLIVELHGDAQCVEFFERAETNVEKLNDWTDAGLVIPDLVKYLASADSEQKLRTSSAGKRTLNSMAKASALREMSVEQLEKALLSKLVAAREQLRKDLGSLDLKIRDLSGGTSVLKAAESESSEEDGPRRRGRPKGSKNRKGRRGPRVKNEKSLRVYVQEELQKAKKGLTIDELIAAVQAAGYKSKSDKFKAVMYQCLFHGKRFQKDDATGKYVLAPE